jgi:WD40 repeat protein
MRGIEKMAEPMQPEYQVGGTLNATDTCYVFRDADDILLDLLLAGKFCYTFNSRQMGKSSLRTKTMARLSQNGVVCGSVDLTGVGTDALTMSQWYVSLIRQLHRFPGWNLKRQVKIDGWLKDRASLAPIELLRDYLETVVLGQIAEQQVVIFIDEIDAVRSLPFDVSDFFGLIRACFNARAEQPEYGRLTFALFGVATPQDLVQDVRKTPFNIGRAVALGGLEYARSLVLVEGLVDVVPDPQAVLREILVWTGGQPFLTQKLCALVQNGVPEMGVLVAGEEAAWVEQLVRSQVIENGLSPEKDEPIHLRTIRDRVLASEAQAVSLLGLYREVLQAGELEIREQLYYEELCLSGLVIASGGKLRVFNPIYAAVFDLAWVEDAIAKSNFPDGYLGQLQAWCQTQEEKYLLQGERLAAGLSWAEKVRVREIDNRFLTTSQTFVRQQLNQAAKIAEQDLRHIKKRIRIGTGILVILGGFSGAALFITALAQGSTVRSLSIQTRELLASGQQNMALIKAIEVGQQFQRLNPLAKSDKETEIQAKIALQQAIHQVKSRLTSPHREADYVEFSPDGKMIASSSRDGVIKIWDINGKEKYTLNISSRSADKASRRNLISSIKFSPDRAMIAAGNSFGDIFIWQASDGKEIQSWKNSTDFEKYGFDEGRTTIEFTADSKNILSAQRALSAVSTRFQLWDLSGKELKSQKFNANANESFSTVSIHAESQTIATGNSDGSISLRKIGEDTSTRLQDTSNRIGNNSFTSLAFSSDGKFLVSGHQNGTTRFWKLNESDPKVFVGSQFSVDRADDSLLNEVDYVGFSHDNSQIISINRDTLSIWNLDGSQIKSAIIPSQGRFVGASVSSNNTVSIALVDQQGAIKLWNSDTEDSHNIHAHQGIITGLFFSPDGKMIVSSGLDGGIQLWNRDGTRAKVLQAAQKLSLTQKNNVNDGWGDKNSTSSRLAINRNPIATSSMALSPDGKMIVSSHWNNELKLWDVSNGQMLQTFTGHSSMIASTNFSSDGKMIVSASQDGIIKLWSLNGKELKQIQSKADIGQVIFSSDGKNLIIAHALGDIMILDLDGKELRTLKGNQGPVYSMSLSPDGKKLVSSGYDGIIRLWDNDGNELLALRGHQAPVGSVNFSPDGEIIISGSADGSIRLWRLDGREIQTLWGSEGAIYKVGFSTDGKTFISGHENGLIKLWDWDVDKLVSLGCNIFSSGTFVDPANRNLCSKK